MVIKTIYELEAEKVQHRNELLGKSLFSQTNHIVTHNKVII